MIEVLAVTGIPLIRAGDEVADIIYSAVQRCGLVLLDGDIIVVAHTIISKAEDRIVRSADVQPSQRAMEIAQENAFDPIQVEIAIRESKSILRDRRVLITETRHGLVCNFAGVDRSNAPPDSYVLLPVDSDKSAHAIRTRLETLSGASLAVIVSDTQGRPWRRGGVNMALGCSGIGAFKYNRCRCDLHGRILERSTVCHVDEIAAAAEAVMGQAAEGTPVVIVRGYPYDSTGEGGTCIPRAQEHDMFR